MIITTPITQLNRKSLEGKEALWLLFSWFSAYSCELNRNMAVVDVTKSCLDSISQVIIFVYEFSIGSCSFTAFSYEIELCSFTASYCIRQAFRFYPVLATANLMLGKYDFFWKKKKLGIGGWILGSQLLNFAWIIYRIHPL